MLRSSADAATVRLRRHSVGGAALWLCLAIVAVIWWAYGVGRPTFAGGGDSADSSPAAVASTVRVHADFQFAETAALTADLESLQSDLSQSLRIPRGAGPIEIYIFADSGGYTRFLHQRYPQVPYRRAMFVQDRGVEQVFAQLGPDFRIDLHHEGTHALLHASLTRVPLWLDEGLAKYFEVPPADRANANPYLPIVQAGARHGTFPRLDMLERLRDVGEMGPREYCSAWAWVHFMLNGPPEAHAELIRYLAELRDNRASGELSDRLLEQLPNLSQLFVQHFAAWQKP